MIDYKLYKTIEILELTVDNLSKQVHNLRQQQENMLDQIQKLKNIAKQNEDRVDE